MISLLEMIVIEVRSPSVPMLSIVLEPKGSSGNIRGIVRLSTQGGHAHRYGLLDPVVEIGSRNTRINVEYHRERLI